jgi:hypothetical protein
MTNQTYSLAVLGTGAHNPFQPELLTISDPNAQLGSQASAMQTGLSFLCKRQDGSEALYRLDAERSTPALPVLIKM